MRILSIVTLTACSALTVAIHAQNAPSVTYQVRYTDGALVCAEGLDPLQSQAMASRVSTTLLNPHVNATGLTIQLRGTAQLNNYPDARAAFVRAAQTWERYISTPITVIIDVDFGPERFGTPYPSPNILGSTNPAYAPAPYSLVRPALLASAWWAPEFQFYSSLPPLIIPTDRGPTATLYASTANLRALRLLPAAPAPTDPAPSIGFNSAFGFDFNRADGIASGRFDFESTAIHEIGHVLGFSSTVGWHEVDTSVPVLLTLLDLFRVRPASNVDLASAQRLQWSGGEHSLQQIGWQVPLSTGRSDGTGGDERQASHWKDDDLGDRYWGVMDPTLSLGMSLQLTANDLAAFDRLGYDMIYPAAPAPPTSLTASATNATTLSLSWIDNATNESEFRLERYNGTRWVEIDGVPANTTRATLTVAGGTAHSFAVRASNAGGYSEYSNVATVTTPVETCTPPRITSQPKATTIARGQAAAISVGASGTAMLLYQWFTGPASTGVAIGNATSPTYNTPALNSSTSYSVRVRNSCGSVDSDVASVTVQASQPPDAPRNLRYDGRTADAVALYWDHDGANVDGFRSYYHDGVTYKKLFDYAASARSCRFINVSSGYSYSFRIVAFNAAGESSPVVVTVPPLASGRRRAAGR